ncbi:hypothetical protein [Rhodovulum sp. P5]|uniref:hypothetical protein n=1 Tax=Rhodovulum sp. P5 TaxID=1564506 RepID=UPI001560C83B|nr:hypothetical protein [Rhodovulum sp. P5]
MSLMLLKHTVAIFFCASFPAISCADCTGSERDPFDRIGGGADFRYRSDAREETIYDGSKSCQIDYEFCNIRAEGSKSKLSFAWVAAGFGMLNGSPLAPSTCAYFVRDIEATQVVQNSELLLSKGRTTIPRTIVNCRGDGSCGDVEAERKDLSNFELKSSIYRPHGVLPFRFRMESQPFQESILVSSSWQLPAMTVGLVLSESAFENDLGGLESSSSTPVSEILISLEPLDNVFGDNARFFELFTVEDNDTSSGEFQFALPKEVATVEGIWFVGVSTTGDMAFYIEVFGARQ